MTPRSTAIRNAHRRAIAKGKPACALCHEEIDYSLVYPDPGAFVVDHIHPRAKGGSDALENKQAAHNLCNRLKSDRLPPAPARAFTTTRQWAS